MAANESILVTGAAGKVGAVGRTVTDLLLERGYGIPRYVSIEQRIFDTKNTYYNVLYPATPGARLTFHVTLPYPWVTQGAKPIEVYDGVTMNTSNGQTCLPPAACAAPIKLERP